MINEGKYTLNGFIVVIPIIIAIVSVSHAYSPSNAQTVPINNSLAYENPEYGFKITYPVNWEKEEHTSLAPDIFAIMFGDIMDENVQVGVTNGSAEKGFNYLFGSNMIKNLNFNVVKNETTTLGGIPAREVVAEITPEQLQSFIEKTQSEAIPIPKGIEGWDIHIIWTTQKDPSYSIIGSARTDLQTNKQIIQQMIDSFEFIK